MRVVLNALESFTKPRLRVQHEQILAMALRPGSIELGVRRSEMIRLTYDSGEMFLCHRHVERWIRTDDLHLLSIVISDTALAAASDRASGETELRGSAKLVDLRIAALVAAVNAERIAGFPSGRLFLDSVEHALAATLVNGYALRRPLRQTYRGGLTSVRLRRVTELVHAKIDDDLGLQEMAESVQLSTAHFSQMFRKSTGQSPHRFVLRYRVEHAKEMLRSGEARVLDVAVACGFKTQQHFARVFRQVCGVSPTQYRQEFLR